MSYAIQLITYRIALSPQQKCVLTNFTFLAYVFLGTSFSQKQFTDLISGTTVIYYRTIAYIASAADDEKFNWPGNTSSS